MLPGYALGAPTNAACALADDAGNKTTSAAITATATDDLRISPTSPRQDRKSSSTFDFARYFERDLLTQSGPGSFT